MSELPTLHDGVVTLRPWREGDDAGRAGAFVIEVEQRTVGAVELLESDASSADVTWTLHAGDRGRGHATRAVRVVVDWALADAEQGGRGLARVQALVPAGHERALRVATRAGLQREGVRRAEPEGQVVLSRLATDPPLSEPGAFRALLNSFLPRKRAISQLLIRDADAPADASDGEPRVLLCRLTYKTDWDLPGGVVEVGESPRLAAAREVTEELALDVPAGRLLLTDWLPPWGGWDDAVCLVFDGGAHPASLVDGIVRQTREIRDAAFCTPAEVVERCADFTARRITAALTAVADGTSGYTESGRP